MLRLTRKIEEQDNVEIFPGIFGHRTLMTMVDVATGERVDDQTIFEHFERLEVTGVFIKQRDSTNIPSGYPHFGVVEDITPTHVMVDRLMGGDYDHNTFPVTREEFLSLYELD
jgi:hypothetical protein